MSNKNKYLGYFLIFISSILLTIFASTYNFAFLSSSLMKAQTQSMPQQEGGGGKPSLFNLNIIVNTNFPSLKTSLQISRIDFINVEIYDKVRYSLIRSENMISNSSLLSRLPLGSYNITITLRLKALFNNLITNSSKFQNVGPTFLDFPLKYSNTTLLLASNTTIIENFSYLLITPNIANIYDFDGNGYLEYENGEYLIATVDIQDIQNLLNLGYKPIWAILFFNNFAIGFSDFSKIYLFSDHMEILISSYPIYKSLIDHRNIENASMYLIFWNGKISSDG